MAESFAGGWELVPGLCLVGGAERLQALLEEWAVVGHALLTSSVRSACSGLTLK